MDLTYTNSKGVDQGVFTAYALDMSYGAEENDFELLVGSDEATVESNAFIYSEGTEYGGIVDGLKASTNGETLTYKGRTWHGMLNSKVIQPDAGENYLIVSGEANEVLAFLIVRLGLSGLFVADEESSGISVSGYQFHRYCKAYDGIRAMLASCGAKLNISWKDRAVHLSAEPIADYTDFPVDGDTATLTVEQNSHKVNHLICLGRGELADREVIHLYADPFGRIGDVQYYTGLDEVCDTYDYSSVESSDELRKEGIKHLTELRSVDKAEISILETEGLFYDIGDIVGASEMKTGVKVTAAVSQKIVKINNGIVSTKYKAEG